MHNNIVYNEYISNREHIHMNSTQWETLTDFTKWLGREGENQSVLVAGTNRMQSFACKEDYIFLKLY